MSRPCRTGGGKLPNELQQALTYESSMCRDQLHQTLRHQVCQEEYADELSTRETNQLSCVVVEQKNVFPRQYEKYAHKQQTLFHEFDSAIKDKVETVQALKHELAKQKEQTLTELEQARQDVERMANIARPAFADGFSAQPYATPIEKKTIHAVAAVAHAVPDPAHFPAFFRCFRQQSEPPPPRKAFHYPSIFWGVPLHTAARDLRRLASHLKGSTPETTKGQVRVHVT